MFNQSSPVLRCAVASLLCAAGFALAQPSSVSYGRITAVSQGTASSGDARTGGAIVGGTVGLISGSGQSSSNRALRTLGGAAAGRAVAGAGSARQTFEYTILVDGRSTISVVTDEAGLRVGDCVAVERGSFNNLRLVDDERCTARAQPTPAALSEANACQKAKSELLRADTDDAFDRAERRVRLLCAD